MKNDTKKIIFITFNILGNECLKTIVNAKFRKKIKVYTLNPEYTKNISDYKDILPFCKKNNVECKLIKNINNYKDEIRKFKPDVIIVIGWSQIIKPEIFNIPKYGCIGFHPALLPKNRGRAAIPWHFINKEKYGGATFFYIDEGCDSGDIISQSKFVLTKKDNAKSYYEKMINEATKLLSKNIKNIIEGKVDKKIQDNNKATYLLIRNEQDSFLDFSSLNTDQIFNQIRAVAYIHPSVYAFYEKKKIIFYKSKIIPKKQNIYSATIGQIIKTSDKSIWVKTLDGIVELYEIRDKNNKPINIPTLFKVGHHLNR